MEKDNLISQVIHIAGKKYPVRLTERESQLVDEVEKELNQKIKDFQLKYVVKSNQDLLVMLLLTYAFDNKMAKESHSAIDHVNKRIESLLQTFATIEEE